MLLTVTGKAGGEHGERISGRAEDREQTEPTVHFGYTKSAMLRVYGCSFCEPQGRVSNINLRAIIS